MKVVMFVEMLQNQNLLLYFLLLLMSIIISITVINVAIITIIIPTFFSPDTSIVATVSHAQHATLNGLYYRLNFLFSTF